MPKKIRVTRGFDGTELKEDEPWDCFIGPYEVTVWKDGVAQVTVREDKSGNVNDRPFLAIERVLGKNSKRPRWSIVTRDNSKYGMNGMYPDLYADGCVYNTFSEAMLAFETILLLHHSIDVNREELWHDQHNPVQETFVASS